MATTAAADTASKPPAKDAAPSAVRRPAGAPAGPSLAERIAALQKTTDNGKQGSSIRSASASYATLPRAGPSSLVPSSARRSASGSQGTNSYDKSTDNAAMPVPVTIKNSAAVKDRLARFQTPDKPLIPRSSFGSPTPMQKEARVLRPYPGAAGSASGQWGEGVLRPQMTGGAFTEGRQVSSDVRPQLTGSAWLGVGGSGGGVSPTQASSATFAAPSSYKGSASPNSLLLRSRSPIGQRDAFQELDDVGSNASSSTSPTKAQPMRRGSSFTEAQMAAASMGLRRASRSASNDGTADSVGTSSVRDDLDSVATTLADQASLGGVEKEKDAKQLESGTLSSVSASSIAARRAQQASASLDAASADGRGSDDGNTLQQKSTPRPSNGLLAQIRSRAGEDSIAESSENSSYDAVAPDTEETDVTQATTLDGSGTHAEGAVAPEAGSTDPKEKELPSPATTRNQSTETSDAVVPPQRSSSMTPSTSTDRVNSRPESRGLPAITTSPQGPSHYAGMRASESSSSIHSASSQEAAQRAKAAISAARARNGSGLPRTASNGHDESPSPSPIATNGTGKSAFAAVKEADSLRRSKTGSIRRPAPGRIMTPAEMDASDDEYEPGWASVTKIMSSSRIQ